MCATPRKVKRNLDPYRGEPEFEGHPVLDTGAEVTCSAINLESNSDVIKTTLANKLKQKLDDEKMEAKQTAHVKDNFAMDDILKAIADPLVEEENDILPPAWAGVELQRIQQQYDTIARITTKKLMKEDKPSRSALARLDEEARRYYKCWTKLHVKNSCLYREKNGRYLAVIPPNKTRKLFDQLHSNPMANAHLGLEKTMVKFYERMWWPRMQSDIAVWIKQCLNCQLVKSGPGYGKLPLLQTVSGDFNDRVAIDLIGPLPVKQEYRYILTIQDYFTKWCEAYPLHRKKPIEVVNALSTNWIARYGPPKSILSDNGQEFAGKVYTEHMRQQGIEVVHTSPYYPRANGMVEKLNGTIQDLLKSCSRETNKDWVDVLPFATSAYRAAKHVTTGFSPNMLVLGREIPLAIDRVYEGEKSNKKETVQYSEWLMGTLRAAKQLAIKNIEKNQGIAKRKHDKKLKP